MEKLAVVRKRRSYPHGCAIDPEVVNNDFIEDNIGGSSDSDRTIESDMFVTMVSTYSACVRLDYVYLYVQFICVRLSTADLLTIYNISCTLNCKTSHHMHHRIVTNYLKVLLC